MSRRSLPAEIHGAEDLGDLLSCGERGVRCCAVPVDGFENVGVAVVLEPIDHPGVRRSCHPLVMLLDLAGGLLFNFSLPVGNDPELWGVKVVTDPCVKCPANSQSAPVSVRILKRVSRTMQCEKLTAN